jgi:hypothetical protein
MATVARVMRWICARHRVCDLYRHWCPPRSDRSTQVAWKRVRQPVPVTDEFGPRLGPDVDSRHASVLLGSCRSNPKRFDRETNDVLGIPACFL